MLTHRIPLLAWGCIIYSCIAVGAPTNVTPTQASAGVTLPPTRDDSRVHPAELGASLDSIKADIKTLKERKRSFRDPDVWAPFVATMVVALGGWFTTLYVFKRSQIAQREALDRQAGERIENNLFDALKLFGGGSQNRSLGLALVTAYRDTNLPAIQRAWKNVLVAQAIYLLTQSEERNNLLELENLRVIMSRLKERLRDLSEGQRANLVKALDRAKRDPRGKVTKEHPEGTPLGVTSETRDLVEWRTLLVPEK